MFQLWEHKYNQELITFRGHNKPITRLELNPDKNGFFSISTDGEVKLWRLLVTGNHKSSGHTFENGMEQPIPSPILKQSDYQSFFGNSRVEKYCRTFSIFGDFLISAFYSTDNILLATGSKNGRVSLWNIFEQKETVLATNLLNPVQYITFCYQNKFVIVASGADIYLYEVKTTRLQKQFDNKWNIKSLLVVPNEENRGNNCLIVVGNFSINLWKWKPTVGISSTMFEVEEMIELYRNEEIEFMSSAITEDGKYLVASSNDYKIRMWNMEIEQLVEEFVNKNG